MTDELKNATPDELLQAAVWFWKSKNPDPMYMLRLGFALAHKNGWEFIAPYWLRGSKEEEA
jgi:hypothetical protein